MEKTFTIAVLCGEVAHTIQAHQVEVTPNGDLLLRNLNFPSPINGFAKGMWDSYNIEVPEVNEKEDGASTTSLG